jgi:hypothetical protein
MAVIGAGGLTGRSPRGICRHKFHRSGQILDHKTQLLTDISDGAKAKPLPFFPAGWARCAAGIGGKTIHLQPVFRFYSI